MKSLVKKEFGKRLKAARKAAGLTQSRLGEIVGVENVTVSRWESGVFLPSESQMPKLTETLGCAPEYFVGLQDAKPTRSVETLAAEVDRQAQEIARLKREAGPQLTGAKRELVSLIAGLDDSKAEGLLRILRRTFEILREDDQGDLSQFELLRKKARG